MIVQIQIKTTICSNTRHIHQDISTSAIYCRTFNRHHSKAFRYNAYTRPRIFETLNDIYQLPSHTIESSIKYGLEKLEVVSEANSNYINFAPLDGYSMNDTYYLLHTRAWRRQIGCPPSRFIRLWQKRGSTRSWLVTWKKRCSSVEIFLERINLTMAGLVNNKLKTK
jgi:hypothetical protein